MLSASVCVSVCVSRTVSVSVRLSISACVCFLIQISLISAFLAVLDLQAKVTGDACIMEIHDGGEENGNGAEC